MRVLVIGGTGLTGPHIVRFLVASGHEVTVFHRGQTPAELPANVPSIFGDKAELMAHRDEFRKLAFDVVLHMAAVTKSDATTFVSTFRGIAGRGVVISSSDVYLAYGRLHHTEPGPPISTPLTEDSPLRKQLSLAGEAYDKTGVEEIVATAPELPATIIRYPAVYGPNDIQHRLYYYVKRMADQRPVIMLRESEARWRWTHVYSENAAWAVALATTNEQAAGRTYNIAEARVLSWQQRINQLKDVMQWPGKILVVPNRMIPESLLPEGRLRGLANFVAMPDYRQDYALDSSRIRTELAYHEVVSPKDGLQRTVEWLVDNAPPLDAELYNYALEDEIAASLNSV